MVKCNKRAPPLKIRCFHGNLMIFDHDNLYKQIKKRLAAKTDKFELI